MRLLFFDGASKCFRGKEGRIFTGANLAGVIVKRYSRYCDKLSILMIDENIDNAKDKFDAVDTSIAEVIPIPNLHKPRKNFFNLSLRKKTVNIIAQEIQKADRVIIRAPGRFNTNVALRLCRKYHKPYLIEAVDFPFEFLYQNKLTRLFAPYAEITAKREIARAPYVIYVSQRVLQERYPSHGKTLACSDVELPELDPQNLQNYLLKVEHSNSTKIIFGTAAGISKLKGQEYVVRALAELRKQGITNIEYHLAGNNSKNYLGSLIHSLGLEDCVKFYGPIPHNKIFDWYAHLDVYIQSSFTEAICRSVLEAMSMALPVICSNAGGNPELADKDMLFTAGNVSEICEAMKKMLDTEVRKREAAYSFTKAKEFEKSKLDPIRDKFYIDFMNSK